MKPIIALGLMLTAAGCAFIGQSPSPQFYILPYLSVPAPAAPVLETIGLAPIRLPRYLDRPQIVTVNKGGQVQLSELHRWAEPLEAGFSRALAESLTARLPGKAFAPLPSALTVTRILEIQVEDFRVEPARCVLTVTWYLRRSTQTLNSQRQTVDVPVPGEDHTAFVAAMSHAVDALAEDIARQLK
ncbi:MAG: PqiC family protein [Methylohalobius sp.]|nr:PqiC family protein [Methylohalobius sp.]